MKSWIVYVTMFLAGVGVGLGGPILLSRYAQPYVPQFLQETMHPLVGTIAHKQREQDRLLMTVTTQDGTILATFRKQIPEIDLLVEEQDSITLGMSQYQPFVIDPPVLKVNKQARPAPALPSHSSIDLGPLSDSPVDSSPSSGESSEKTDSPLSPLN